MTLAALSMEAGTTTLAAGARDIRGWRVRTLVDDVAAGTVHDLLLDEDGLVRWLDLALARGRHVLVPAGQGRAEATGRIVRLPGLAADQLALLPAYDHAAGELDPPAEELRLGAYAAALLREPGLAPRSPPLAPVVPLASMRDFRVAGGDPDPRGWGLVGAGGERLGRVEELLVDVRLLRARYLVCRTRGEERLVRIPVGRVRLDPGAELVRVERLSARSLSTLPTWSATATAPTAAPLDPEAAAVSVRDDPRLDPRALFGEQAT